MSFQGATRTDPHERLLAHMALISDEWWRSGQGSKDGAREDWGLLSLFPPATPELVRWPSEAVRDGGLYPWIFLVAVLTLFCLIVQRLFAKLFGVVPDSGQGLSH
jgi:hypothetical protein